MTNRYFPESLMDGAPLHWVFAVDELEAGRALDKHIALDIMGWTFVPEPHHPRAAWRITEPQRQRAYGVRGASWVVEYDIDFMEFAQVPHYSTDMNAALEVAHRAFVYGGDSWSLESNTSYDRLFRATFLNRTHDEKKWPDYHSAAGADTAPLAICRAAILLKRWHDTPYEKFVDAFRHQYDSQIEHDDPMPPLRDNEDRYFDRKQLTHSISELLRHHESCYQIAYVSGGKPWLYNKPEGEPRWYVERLNSREKQEHSFTTFFEAMEEALHINKKLMERFTNKEES